MDSTITQQATISQTKPKAGDAARTAIQLIEQDRNATYGDAYNDFTRVVELFRIVTGIHLTVEQALSFMLCVKLLRERSEHHTDNLVDLIGYTSLLEYVYNVTQRNAKENIT